MHEDSCQIIDAGCQYCQVSLETSLTGQYGERGENQDMPDAGILA